jgi:hypothetical protein
VGNEGFEAVVVVAGKEESGVAAIAGADAAETRLITPWLSSDVVDSAQIVAYVLSAVIAGNLVEPFLTERRDAATVGRNNNISLSSYEL